MLDQLLDDGHLGIFAAFLIFQFFTMQKRLDKLVDGFQEQIDEIRKDYDARTERMRERYDRVITEYRDREESQGREFMIARTKVHNEIVSKLDRMLDRDK